MRISVLSLGLAICLTSAAAIGCRSANPYEVGREADAVTLVVKNDNFSDIDVYGVADFLATRIGTVNGNSTQRFELSPSMTGGADLRIVATPIGGNGRASSGTVIASRGQTIYFNVAPVLRQSSATVR
jgi:hypothetical protein